MCTQSCPALCNPMDCNPNCNCQAPLSMEFSRREYWSGLPFSTPGDLPNPGIEPASLASPALEADFLPLYHLGNPTLDSFINSSVVSFTHCGKTGVSLLPKLFPSWWIRLKSRWEWDWGYVNGQDSWTSSEPLFYRTWASSPYCESEVCVRQVGLRGKKCGLWQELLCQVAGGQAAAHAHCCSVTAAAAAALQGFCQARAARWNPQNYLLLPTPLSQSLSPIFRIP